MRSEDQARLLARPCGGTGLHSYIEVDRRPGRVWQKQWSIDQRFEGPNSRRVRRSKLIRQVRECDAGGKSVFAGRGFRGRRSRAGRSAGWGLRNRRRVHEHEHGAVTPTTETVALLPFNNCSALLACRSKAFLKVTTTPNGIARVLQSGTENDRRLEIIRGQAEQGLASVAIINEQHRPSNRGDDQVVPMAARSA